MAGRAIALFTALVLALALTAAPAWGGADFQVAAAKDKDGPYDFFPNLNVPQGEKKTVWWRIKSRSENPQQLSFDDAATPNPNPEGFRIRWYKGDREVTDEVKGAGRNFTLPADGNKYFRATVKKVEDGPGFCLGGQASNGGSDAAYFKVNGNSCG